MKVAKFRFEGGPFGGTVREVLLKDHDPSTPHAQSWGHTEDLRPPLVTEGTPDGRYVLEHFITAPDRPAEQRYIWRDNPEGAHANG